MLKAFLIAREARNPGPGFRILSANENAAIIFTV